MDSLWRCWRATWVRVWNVASLTLGGLHHSCTSLTHPVPGSSPREEHKVPWESYYWDNILPHFCIPFTFFTNLWPWDNPFLNVLKQLGWMWGCWEVFTEPSHPDNPVLSGWVKLCNRHFLTLSLNLTAGTQRSYPSTILNLTGLPRQWAAHLCTKVRKFCQKEWRCTIFCLPFFFFYTLVCLFLCYVSHCKSLIHFCLVLNLAYYGCNGLVRTSISTTRFSKFLVLKKCGEWQKTMVSVWMRNRRLMITAYSITSVQTCYCEHRHQS